MEIDLKKASSKHSWQMTVEELRAEVREAEEDYEKGECIAHKVFVKEQAQW
jgi:hypothetical protein